MTPSELSEKLMEESAQFSQYCDELADILQRKPAEWLKLRTGATSDTQAERMYSNTPDGVQEVILRLKIKACEKSMSAIKARLRVVELEVRNQI